MRGARANGEDLMITILCVGKLKEQYLIKMCEDYKTRINKYHKLEIIEIKDSNKQEECKIIEKSITKYDQVLTLDINGKTVNTEEFKEIIEQRFTNGESSICFIIGGSYGLTEKIKQISNQRISFSKLTFPHGLFRAILLEQIYRSMKLMNSEKYHK